MYRAALLTISLLFLSGCPVLQPQDVPAETLRLKEPSNDYKYRLYAPSYYSPDRDWPLVVALHGTHLWDTSEKQVDAWKKIAEGRGFIVAAPDLKSVQGILPRIEGLWKKDLARDEQAILNVIDDVSRRYTVDKSCVLLTSFSAGGYPLYYTGLRNPGRFSALAAVSSNCDVALLDEIGWTPDARELPIVVLYGQSDPRRVQKHSWAAFRYLRENGFMRTDRRELEGGHFRRPAEVMAFWDHYLPEKYRPGQ